LLVVVATDDSEANALIAAQARSRNRLVNVVAAADQGNCITPAVHRSGDLVVAVTTGRVPVAAARIRGPFEPHARRALCRLPFRELASIRRAFLNRGDRARWAEACEALIGDDFSESVEGRVSFDARVAEWR